MGGVISVLRIFSKRLSSTILVAVALLATLALANAQIGINEVTNRKVFSTPKKQLSPRLDNYKRLGQEAIVEAKRLIEATDNLETVQEIDGIVLEERFEPRFNWKFRRATFVDNEITLRDALNFLIHHPHRMMEISNETQEYIYLDVVDSVTKVAHIKVAPTSGATKLPLRDLVIVGAWEVDPSTGSFYIATQSVEHPQAPITPEYIRMHAFPMGTKTTRLPGGGVEMVTVINTDVKYPDRLSPALKDIFGRAKVMENLIELREYLRHYPY